MLINVFNYKGHIICIRAYSGTYETLVYGNIVSVTYSEAEAVQSGKDYIKTLPETPDSKL